MSPAAPDRTYDVSAFRGQKRTGDVLLTPALAGPGDGGELIAGVLKVAQWFLVEFLTDAGSFPYDSGRGTGFVQALLQGRLQTDTDVFVAFGLAIGDVQAAASLVEPADAPPDERFDSADLTGVTLLPGQVRLSITLTTMAGTSRPILLPIATTP